MDTQFIGEAEDDWAGTSVGSAGDMDGDGHLDMVLLTFMYASGIHRDDGDDD